jgi:hypothetical protein
MSAHFTPTRTAPDESLLGRDLGYPVGTAQTYFYDEAVRAGSFSSTGEIDFAPGRWARLGAASAAGVMPLPDAAQAGALWTDFSYPFSGELLDFADYLARQRVMGLMVLQGGRRWCEACQYGRGPQHRFLGHSLAKSVTSLAFGLALAEGLLPTLHLRVDALAPRFCGHAVWRG